jgi:AcrR family transcriptional regulator
VPPASGGRARRGRPRESVEGEVLEATMDLLREVGSRRATINAIAARSGRSKSTIYRRWATRDEILLDALRLAAQGRPDDVRHVIELERKLGSTIHAAARRGAAVFDSAILRAVLPTITRELLEQTAIGEGFRVDIFLPIREAAKVRLHAAVERGEVSPGVDGDLVFDLVYGAMLYRSLVGQPMTDEVADALADLLMRGVAGPAYQPTMAAPGRR